MKEKKQCGFIHVTQYEGETEDGRKYHEFETHAEGSRKTLIDCMCTLVSYLADNGPDSIGDILGEMIFRTAYLKMKEATGDAFYKEDKHTTVKMDPEAADHIKEILKKKGGKEENGNDKE